MTTEKNSELKQPGFMISISFNGKQGATSFMSRDMSKESVAYILWMNIAHFFESVEDTKDGLEKAMDDFLIGFEEVAEKSLGVTPDDKIAATQKIVADLRATKAAQAKKTTKKPVTKKKK